jgi:hypothetical protein
MTLMAWQLARIGGSCGAKMSKKGVKYFGMAITVYTGTPGSGKSFHAAKDIVRRLKRGGGLICNFPINEGYVKKKKTHVEYWDNSEFSVERFVKYALDNHKIGKEGQTLVVIDECQILFNCRDFGRKDRNAWVNLFAQHRKLGFNFILITQSDRFLDKQIRALIEEEVRHRKLNNYGIGGLLLGLTFKTWFIAISYWYGGNKLLTGKEVFAYKKKYEKIYDSYRMFSGMVIGMSAGAVAGGAGGDRFSGGAPGEAGDGPDGLAESEPAEHNEEVQVNHPLKKKWIFWSRAKASEKKLPDAPCGQAACGDQAETIEDEWNIDQAAN